MPATYYDPTVGQFRSKDDNTSKPTTDPKTATAGGSAKPGDATKPGDPTKPGGEAAASDTSKSSDSNSSGSSSRSDGSKFKVEQYSFNNAPHEVTMYLDNGTQQLGLNPQAIVYLNIDDSLSKWYITGELVIEYSYEHVENGALFAKDLDNYVFRNDGFDFLKITITPTDPVLWNSNNSKHNATSDSFHYADLPQEKLELNLWLSIYDIEDLETPVDGDMLKTIVRYKKFYFRDYRYQKMVTTVPEYSTALSPELASVPTTAPDEARSLSTGKILHEIIKKLDVDDDLKQTALEASKPGDWDEGGTALFVTTGAAENMAELVDYVLDKHIAKEGKEYPTSGGNRQILSDAVFTPGAGGVGGMMGTGMPMGSGTDTTAMSGASGTMTSGASGDGGAGVTKDGISSGALMYAMRMGASETGAGVYKANQVVGPGSAIGDPALAVGYSYNSYSGITGKHESWGAGTRHTLDQVRALGNEVMSNPKFSPNKMDVGYFQCNADEARYGIKNYGSYEDQVTSLARHVQNQMNKNPAMAQAINSGNYSAVDGMNGGAPIPGWKITKANSNSYEGYMQRKRQIEGRLKNEFGGDPWAMMKAINGELPSTPSAEELAKGAKVSGGSGGGYNGPAAAGGGGGGAGTAAAGGAPGGSSSAYVDIPKSTSIHDVCLLTLERGPKKGSYGYFTLKPISKYFEGAGKSENSPGDLQYEHFYLQTPTGAGVNAAKAGYLAPIKDKASSTASELKDLAIGGRATIKNYKFVDVAADFNSRDFKSRVICSFDFKQRIYSMNFESSNVELARKFMAEHYIDNVFTGSGDKEEKFLLNINKDKKNKKNVQYVSSLYGGSQKQQLIDGIHHLLYNGVFQNACINFDILGQTFREPGTFIGIDRPMGSDLQSTFDTRFCGQWFIIKVIHHFTRSAYFNNITAVRVHRHTPLEVKFTDF